MPVRCVNRLRIAIEVETLFLKNTQNHSFHLDFAWKPLWEGTKTKKSLSPCVWGHRNGLVCRMTTPFALLDNLGPKQLPESIQRLTEPTRKFFYAPQTPSLRLKRLNFWIKNENFDGFSSKNKKNVPQLASATIKNDWCRFRPCKWYRSKA